MFILFVMDAACGYLWQGSNVAAEVAPLSKVDKTWEQTTWDLCIPYNDLPIVGR